MSHFGVSLLSEELGPLLYFFSQYDVRVPVYLGAPFALFGSHLLRSGPQKGSPNGVCASTKDEQTLQ